MDARAVYIVNNPVLCDMILYIMLSAISRNASGSLMLKNIIMWNLNKKNTNSFPQRNAFENKDFGARSRYLGYG